MTHESPEAADGPTVFDTLLHADVHLEPHLDPKLLADSVAQHQYHVRALLQEPCPAVSARTLARSLAIVGHMSRERAECAAAGAAESAAAGAGRLYAVAKGWLHHASSTLDLFDEVDQHEGRQNDLNGERREMKALKRWVRSTTASQAYEKGAAAAAKREASADDVDALSHVGAEFAQISLQEGGKE